MEVDDAPILRYLYRNLKPCRHLEFGTWQDQGALYVLEEFHATVRTINFLEGETGAEQNFTYGHFPAETSELNAWLCV